jgi:hypothetical protein
MKRRSIVEFEKNLLKQIADEKAALVGLEGDVMARRVRIDTLEAVAADLKTTVKTEVDTDD